MPTRTALNTLVVSAARVGIDCVRDIVMNDHGKPVCVAVVNERRILTAFENLGNCKEAVADLAIAKAKTAIYLEKDTIELHGKVDPSNYPDYRVTCFGGAVLVLWKGAIIGAVGVSGRKAARKFLSDDERDEAASGRWQDHELALVAEQAIVAYLVAANEVIEEHLAE